MYSCALQQTKTIYVNGINCLGFVIETLCFLYEGDIECLNIILIIGLCTLLRVYQLNIRRPEDGRQTGPKHVV
jgi:hypothetical protein